MKQINIMPFGQLADVTGSAEFILEAEDTDGLQELLWKKYPELRNRKYAIAVNKQMITHNLVFSENAVVALLPPFSGG